MRAITLIMRENYVHLLGALDSSHEAAIVAGASRALYREDPLAWCFRMLTTDLRDKPGPQIVMAELDRLLELDKALDEHIDYTLRSLLSSFAICWRMHEILRFHRPSYQPQTIRGVLYNNERAGYENRIWFPFCCGFIKSILDAPFTLFLANVERYAPAMGKKDLSWLSKEKGRSLDVEALWSDFENEMWVVVGKRNAEPKNVVSDRGPLAIIRALAISIPKSYDEAQEALEAHVQGKHQQRLDQTTARQNETYTPPSAPVAAESVLRHDPKKKPKTRGTTQHSPSEIDIAAPAASEATPEPTFTVKKKCWFIIEELFPSMSDEVGLSVSWRGFLNFMADLGDCIEPIGGSVYAFLLPGRGRVNVHRPHPDSTLQTHHLRNRGTGMGKASGWTRENFRQAQA